MAVRVVITDRVGGVSAPPFDTLNLASHVGDDPDAVAANRARLAAFAEVPSDRLVVLAAISGGPVAVVDSTSPAEVTGVEALVTAEPDLALAVIAADCVPVLLADDVAGVVAVAHAGRRGVAARIVTQALTTLVGLGADPARVQAWIGPSICGRCYEVGDDVAAEVTAVAPAAPATTSWGTTALDLPAAVEAELAVAGVVHVERDPRCTAEDPLLYSYRRDGRTGRQACVVVRSPRVTEQPPHDRREAIATGLAATHARIESACADAGRRPDDVTLVVVTKTFPASDVRHLHALGVRDVGENRHPEAGDKAAATADLDLRWHFIGQLQTNKARAVTGYAHAVHSLDRAKLARALATGAADHGRTLDVLLQVSLDDAPGRGGAATGDVPALADLVARLDGLRLRGLMAVAPLEADPDEAFARLAMLSEALRADHPQATWVSAGMSGDLEAAIRHGATHVRVGSAILGSRPTPR